MEKNLEYGRGDIKRLVWTGPTVETGEGQIIHGVVGVTHDGKHLAGYGSLYQEYGPRGRVIEQRTAYSWEGPLYQEKDHAIFAARTAVQKELQCRPPEPDHAGRNHLAVESQPIAKGRFFDKIIERMGSRSRAEKPAPGPWRSRSIDR